LNYLAHALPFLDRPYFVAGTAVPDWLAVADRAVRVRAKHAAPLVEAEDPCLAAVAGGLLQHFRDDRRFHETRAFAETSLELTAAFRRALGPETGFRAAFLGHVLVEVLLDAELAAEDVARLDAYQRALEAIEPRGVQNAVNRMVRQPTLRLAPLIDLFRRERILWDYLEDAKLWVRLNQVLRRVGLPCLPDQAAAVLPLGRQLVRRRRRELLEGIPVSG
jgi:hypothetical protein